MSRHEPTSAQQPGGVGVSLAKRQRDRALIIALQNLLRRGTPPDQGEVAEEFNEQLPPIMGEPFFQLREQIRRGKFRVDWQNQMFREAGIDLRLLFDQNIEVVETILGHLALAEVTGRRTGLEIRALRELLEDQLLTSQRATNFFFTIFDAFTDISKIDQVQSDVAIDLTNAFITLQPESSTARIRLEHLLEQTQAPVRVLEPAGAISRQLPGSRFAHAFEDLLTAWQQQILTATQEPVELSIVIPIVPPMGGASEVLTRIQLHSISATPFTVLPLWAKDGVAFSRFQQVPEPVLVEDETVTIDFEPVEATVIQLRLRKEGPDGEEEVSQDQIVKVRKKGQASRRVPRPGRMFSTVFGFRQISFWRMGYKREGTLISKPQTPEGENLPNISKVSLEVDERVPEGSQIRYAIATAADPTSFIPITPLTRQDDSEAPTVIDFESTQRSTREENAFTIDAASPPTALGKIRGTEFFALRTVADTAIFRTSKLWRGKNAWHCQRSIESTIRAVRNLFVDFSRSDVQKLYVFEEDERIAVHPSNDGTTEIELETRFAIQLESDEFQAGQDLLLPTDVSRPNYSIRRLLRRPVTGSVSSTQATGDLTIQARDAVTSQAVASQPGSPTAGRAGAVVQINSFAGAGLVPSPLGGSGVVPDLVGVPFRLTYVVNSLTISGTFTTLNAQLAADGTLTLQLDDPTGIIRTATGTLAALSAAWEILAINMTRSIRQVVGNKLKLDRNQKLGVEDMVEVTYRRSLLPSEVPITNTVVVRASTDESQVYELGRDFSLDLASRTISRTPSGNIGLSGDQSAQAVRVSFSFEEQLLGLVTYRTYLFNSEPSSKLTLERIQVDRENGEEVLLETGGGMLDLNDRDDLPPLPAGWHQLVVRSDSIRNPDGTINRESAIYKAINLREIRNAADSGRFLMPATSHPDATGDTTNRFATVFTRQAAFLTPMQQVTFQQLTTGVRQDDHSVFAIKDAAEAPVTGGDVVVTNFDPRIVDNDLLYFPPDLTGSGIPLGREDFEFEYAFVPADVTSLTGLILRATLERSPDVDGSVTPILRRYVLRLSY